MQSMAFLTVTLLAIAFAPFLIYIGVTGRIQGRSLYALDAGLALLSIGMFGLIARFCNIVDSMALGALIVCALAYSYNVMKRKGQGKVLLILKAGHFAFWPVISVFLFRAFVLDVFHIPSESMMPDMVKGDLIFVGKYSYGIKMPILGYRLIPFSSPERGDVVVFRNPQKETENYVKRIVGIPGDYIEYFDKKIRVNGVFNKYEKTGNKVTYYEFPKEESHVAKTSKLNGKVIRAELWREYSNGKWNEILIDPNEISFRYWQVESYPTNGACESVGEYGIKCRVPDGMYFVMGDNRDHSVDSRYFGFVNEREILGKVLTRARSNL